MKRAALHESIRRVVYTEEGMRTGVVNAMADEILATIEAEHPGAVEP